jgi:serine/threonine-protein kinase HipA
MNNPAQHVQQLGVFMHQQLVGTLAQDSRGQIWFEYNAAWLSSGFALSPMPSFGLKAGAFKAANQTFHGLHGIFNDALPDGWGLLLMDRALKKNQLWDAHQITPLDRLAYIGHRAMGALEFKPLLSKESAVEAPSLTHLAEEAMLVQEGLADQVLSALYIHGGSPGGARPKVTVAIDAQSSQKLMSGFEEIPDSFDHWIVKFRSQATDPQDMGRIELAYAKMAEAAKVEMPPCMLITAKVRGAEDDFFAVKRFDRVKNQKRHVISLGGMLEASHREPCLDYTQLLKTVHFATRNMQDVERAFRLMVFNVLSHNKDDHVKNFAFLHDSKHWQFAPAFDLTFSGGMNNQHTTAIAGEGNPSLKAIQKVAAGAGIKHWQTIVEEVFTAVAQWPQFAQAQGVSPAITAQYLTAMQAEPCFAELKG